MATSKTEAYGTERAADAFRFGASCNGGKPWNPEAAAPSCALLVEDLGLERVCVGKRGRGRRGPEGPEGRRRDPAPRRWSGSSNPSPAPPLMAGRAASSSCEGLSN